MNMNTFDLVRAGEGGSAEQDFWKKLKQANYMRGVSFVAATVAATWPGTLDKVGISPERCITFQKTSAEQDFRKQSKTSKLHERGIIFGDGVVRDMARDVVKSRHFT